MSLKGTVELNHPSNVYMIWSSDHWNVHTTKTYLFHFLQEYFHSRVFEEGHIDKEEIVEAVSVPDGVSVNVVVAIPFLDVNPIAGSE